MKTERAAAPAKKKCPKCGGHDINDLASSESVLRFQCVALKCLHSWEEPRERGLSAIREAMERREVQEKEEANVANLKCKECGKKYIHPKRLETHEASCRGAGDGSVEENPDLPNPKPAAKPAKAKKAKASGLMDSVVAMLQDKRTERIAALTAEDAQLQEIDKAISLLSGNPT